MDWRIVHALNGFAARHDLFEDPVTRYVKVSEVLFAALLVVLFLFVARHREAGARAAVSGLASAGLALLVAQVVSDVVARPRPFAAHPGQLHLFVGGSADAGFPSDHATAGFAIAVAILIRSRRWGVPALVLAAVLATGRVLDGVHYPTDVLAGAALGTSAALLLWAVRPVRRLLDRFADALAARRDRAFRRLGLARG